MGIKLSYNSWMVKNRDRLEKEYHKLYPHDLESRTIMTNSKLKYFMAAHQEYMNDKR